MDSLNFNSVVTDAVATPVSIEHLPGLNVRAVFKVNSFSVFKDNIDISPTIIDDRHSYIS